MGILGISFNLGGYISEQLQRVGINITPTVAEGIAAFIFFSLAFIAGWIVYHIFEHYFTKWAEKTETTLDDEIIRNIKKPIYFFVILVGLFYGLDQLTMLDPYAKEISQIFMIGEILLVVFIITRIINVILTWYAERLAKQKKTVIDNHILNIFKKFLHAIVYILGFFLILYVLNINLSGAVIGLGVGGIAIAFALQNILSDVFSAFSIYFDRPFEVGDLIVVGQNSGTVTKIGLQSTRMQLIQGEEMIVSNREITSGSVRNFKKMSKRRVEFILRVAPTTPLDQLKKIPKIIEKTIKKCVTAEFNMAHLREIGPFSYNYEIVYYINTGDYNTFLDLHETVNISLKESLDKEGIQLGFQGKEPSQ
jgi:small-conductance mechanosensitive channel